MSKAAGMGWTALGQGLMGIGQNVSSDWLSSLEQQAEDQKSSRAEMFKVTAMAMDHQVKTAQMEQTAQQSALDEAYRGERLAIDRKQVDATIDNKKALTALQEQIANVGTWKQQQDVGIAESELDLKEDQFEWQQDTWEQRYAQDVRGMDLKEQDMFHRHAMNEAQQALNEGKFELAQKELDLAKRTQSFREDIATLEQERADRSLHENINQFNTTYDLKVLEHELNEKRIEAGIASTEERDRLAQRSADLADDIYELDKLKLDLEGDRLEQQKVYQEATIDLAEEELEYKKGQGKWKLTTRPIMQEVVTTEASPGVPEKRAMQKVGEEIIAINLEDPELKDIRILQENGSWLYGSPDGLESEFKERIMEVRYLLGKKNPVTGTEFTVSGAIDHLKKTIPEYKLWDEIRDRFVIIKTSEVTTPYNPITETPAQIEARKRKEAALQRKLDAANNKYSLHSNPPGLITPEGSLVDEAVAAQRYP